MREKKQIQHGAEILPEDIPKHPHYPDGYPEAKDKRLLGRHECLGHIVEVEEHPHGYLVRVLNRGPMFTVGGDHPETVEEYLIRHGSPYKPQHIKPDLAPPDTPKVGE